MAEALSVMPDEIVAEDLETVETPEPEGEPEAEGDEVEVPEPEGEPEEPKAAPAPESSADLKRVANLLEEHIRDQRTPKKEDAPAKPEGELTDAQLQSIMEKYGDNPAIMLQVHQYVAKRESERVKAETLKEERARQWAESTRNSAMGILKSEFGKLAPEEQAVVRDALPELMENLGLGNHPAGALAAFAIVRMAQLSDKQKAATEEPAKPAEGKPKGQMDKTRKAPGADDGGKGRLTAEDREVMAALGLKDPKLFLKFKGQGA